jgi:PAS domain-containing protein
VTELVGTHINVTEQHLAMEALQKAFDEIKQSEDRLRLVIDTIPTLVWRAGPDGVPDFLNQTALDYTGLSLRRNGANTREVADLIGDESERMGAHYTRHVEAEQNIIRAFSRIKDRQDKA